MFYNACFIRFFFSQKIFPTTPIKFQIRVYNNYNVALKIWLMSTTCTIRFRLVASSGPAILTETNNLGCQCYTEEGYSIL